MLIFFLQNTSPPILPILNDQPPHWNGEDNIRRKDQVLPSVPIVGNDGVAYDTYFFEPKEGAAAPAFQSFASRNKESVASLLIQFFYKFSFGFDFRKSVVSIRVKGGIDREDKGKDYGWKRHARLAIEDPFEVGYDVAHVVRDEAHVSRSILSQVDYICLSYISVLIYISIQRAITLEFAKAYSHLATALNNVSTDFSSVFNVMCQEVTEPPVKVVRIPSKKGKEAEE